ncbi:50S ribosomal protein L25 [Buchnera aphidicola]|uniref:50S ribosomal protein L25 n=1 Tax=Buchnera aphidicola subsp. Cinara cedri (strain Cc) TaxID=372461 RepID=Q057Y4_BUCCC|nr:50S ribosomal protein L25 [Buchnera aphidicola]ABJ90565.1 50S ribosomal protein L25 [Buchnera aphidicola BCc]
MIKLQAIYRNKLGTNNSRYFRNFDKKIPAIIYGKKFLEKELFILLDHNIIFNLQKEKNFFSNNFLIKLKNKSFFSILQDIQFHVFKPIILHIDFLCIK